MLIVKSMENIKTRNYKEGDEKGINKLFNKLFSQFRTLEEWNHRFKENPAVTDIADWVMVIENEEEIVGHYAALPLDIRCNNKTYKVNQPVDTMLDTSLRLGSKTIKELFGSYISHLIKNNIAVGGFGFPNEVAYLVGKRRIGYKDLGKMKQLFKRLSIKAAVKRRFPGCPNYLLKILHFISKYFCLITLVLKDEGDYKIEFFKSFDDRVDLFWDMVANNFPIIVERNKKYLQWRYCGDEYIKFYIKDSKNVVGYAVLKIVDQSYSKVGYIIDILCTEVVYKHLLIRVLKYFVNRDVDYVLYAHFDGNAGLSCFNELGFKSNKGFPDFPVVYFLLTNDLDEDFINKSEHWNLTFGDIDGY